MCCKPWFPFFSFLLVIILYVIQILFGLKTFMYISFVFFRSLIRNFLFSFAFFRSLIGNFLFLLLLKHDCSLTVNGSSFLGDPSVPSSEGKDKNFYPRLRFMANELRFWLERLVEGWTWCMPGIFVRCGSGIRECPTLFPWYACNNDDLETYAKLIMHAPMRTLKYEVCGHVSLRLGIHFAYLNQPKVSKRCSFINLCIHLSPFQHSGKLPQHSPFRCTHIFFKNPHVFWLVKIFQRKKWQLFLFKSVLAFLFCYLINYCFSM